MNIYSENKFKKELEERFFYEFLNQLLIAKFGYNSSPAALSCLLEWKNEIEKLQDVKPEQLSKNQILEKLSLLHSKNASSLHEILKMFKWGKKTEKIFSDYGSTVFHCLKISAKKTVYRRELTKLATESKSSTSQNHSYSEIERNFRTSCIDVGCIIDLLSQTLHFASISDSKTGLGSTTNANKTDKGKDPRDIALSNLQARQEIDHVELIPIELFSKHSAFYSTIQYTKALEPVIHQGELESKLENCNDEINLINSSLDKINHRLKRLNERLEGLTSEIHEINDFNKLPIGIIFKIQKILTGTDITPTSIIKQGFDLYGSHNFTNRRFVERYYNTIVNPCEYKSSCKEDCDCKFLGTDDSGKFVKDCPFSSECAHCGQKKFIAFNPITKAYCYIENRDYCTANLSKMKSRNYNVAKKEKEEKILDRRFGSEK